MILYMVRWYIPSSEVEEPNPRTVFFATARTAKTYAKRHWRNTPKEERTHAWVSVRRVDFGKITKAQFMASLNIPHSALCGSVPLCTYGDAWASESTATGTLAEGHPT